jgi:NAD(P)-dependent dehydrogenase (short-subunit alcohol dehydrogenase family)
VLVNYRTDRSAAEKVVAAIAADGGRAVAVQADVADTGQLRGLFDAAGEHLGRLGVVVSNAGIGLTVPIAEATDADFGTVFAMNTRAVFVVLREAAVPAGRRRADHRHLSRRPAAPPGWRLYAASKAAADALVRAAAQELGLRQITVNSVLPGATRTDMWARRSPSVGADREGVSSQASLTSSCSRARVIFAPRTRRGERRRGWRRRPPPPRPGAGVHRSRFAVEVAGPDRGCPSSGHALPRSAGQGTRTHRALGGSLQVGVDRSGLLIAVATCGSGWPRSRPVR